MKLFKKYLQSCR